jgi:diguanylate cyclase (GGDEF)-like protein
MQDRTARIASSRLIISCATIAAMILFVGLGSQVFGPALRDSNVPNTSLTVAFLLNIAIILFGWRRAKDLQNALDAYEQAERLAQRNASIDAATGLSNRKELLHSIRDALEAKTQGVLLLVDLDHFKRVNDSLGHLVGDTLLRTVAGRITECLRGSDVVARFGGDEFMVLLPAAQQRDDAEEVAHKLLRAIEAPMEVEDQSLSVTPSIGIAFFPDHGQTPATLIKHADTAMYVAKSRGRANCQFFEASMAHMAYEALLLEIQLGHALERGEFELLYQPLVRAGDGACVGAEALIRWHHPERGLLGPEDFVPVAEQRRQMQRIGRWSMRQALRAAKGWRERHSRQASLPVTVNLSSLEFHAPDFVDDIAGLLHEEGVPGDWLELDLTERVLMDDIEGVQKALARLKRLGVRVAIDDFGTGHSSLAHLRELAVDRIKIDHTFVGGLPGDASAEAIVRAVVQLAHGLKLTVTAEGVETERQRAALAAMGCDVLQGYLISRPLAAAAFGDWLAQRAKVS